MVYSTQGTVLGAGGIWLAGQIGSLLSWSLQPSRGQSIGEPGRIKAQITEPGSLMQSGNFSVLDNESVLQTIWSLFLLAILLTPQNTLP